MLQAHQNGQCAPCRPRHGSHRQGRARRATNAAAPRPVFDARHVSLDSLSFRSAPDLLSRTRACTGDAPEKGCCQGSRLDSLPLAPSQRGLSPHRPVDSRPISAALSKSRPGRPVLVRPSSGVACRGLGARHRDVGRPLLPGGRSANIVSQGDPHLLLRMVGLDSALVGNVWA
jgi:hypothetical protein